VAQAERLPLGGEREVVLATFLAARLTWDAARIEPSEEPLWHARAANARIWVQSLALPVGVREPLQRLLDVLASGDRSSLRGAWERVTAAVTRGLDVPSRNDLRAVGARLAAQPRAAEREA
jgi:hypothetical protein